jgi:hypothetical protein
MNQKRCGMDDGRLQEYLDRTLDRAGRAEVETHLAGCPACAGELESFHRLYSRLSALPLFSPDPDFDRLVLSMVLPQRRRVLGISPLGWVAAVYFVFTMGLLFAALLLAGYPLSGGPGAVLTRLGDQAVHGFVQGVGALAVAWAFLRDFGGSMGSVLMRLLQVPLRVVTVSAASPDGRFYVALSVCTALAFFMIVRRDSRRGVRHVRI